jgi:hypothetical protein
MKKFRKIIALVLILIMIFVPAAIADPADGAVSISASADKSSYAKGGKVLLSVAVADISPALEIAAMDFYIKYDGSVFSASKASNNLVDFSAGDALDRAEDLSVSSPDDGLMKVLYFGADSSSITTLTKNGMLFETTLTVADNAPAGSYTFSLGFAADGQEEGQACDKSGTEVGVAFSDISVEIVDSQFTNPYKFVPNYEDKGYISGFSVGSSVLQVKQSFNASTEVTVKDSEGGDVADSAPIGTGMTISVGGETFTAVVYGDVNGDGNINTDDSATSEAYLSSLISPDGAFRVSFDVNKDNSVTTDDIAMIDGYLASITDISQ